MLGTIVAEIMVIQALKEDAGTPVEAGRFDFPGRRPAGRAVAGDIMRLPGAPQRAGHRRAASNEAARTRDRTHTVEGVRGVGVEMIPPWKKRPGMIDRPAAEDKPRQAQLGLPCQPPRRPFGREPNARDHDAEQDNDLAKN
jgi:hypothetical protein